MNASLLSRLRAEHAKWTVERTPGLRTIGYTASRNTEGAAEQVRAVNLIELEKRLRGLDSRVTVGHSLPA